MATTQTGVRLGPDLIEEARQRLGLPPGTPAAEIIRAAMRRIAGLPDMGGRSGTQGKRPARTPPVDTRETVPVP